MEFSNGPTGKLNLDVRICRQYPDFKVHCGKIAKNPGSQWRTQARYGTRVYQPSDASLDISLLSDFGFVAMSATDQVIVAAAGHSVTDMRKMGQKIFYSDLFQMFRFILVECSSLFRTPLPSPEQCARQLHFACIDGTIEAVLTIIVSMGTVRNLHRGDTAVT